MVHSKLQSKVWALIRIYLLCRLLQAKYAHLGTVPKEGFTLDRETIKKRQEHNMLIKIYYDILSGVVKLTSKPPASIAKALDNYRQREKWHMVVHANKRFGKLFRDFLAPSELKNFKYLMSLAWEKKKIVFLIKADRFLIHENRITISSVSLVRHGSGNFIALHASKESHDFFNWAIRYFDIMDIPTQKIVSSFKENEFISLV